MSVAWPCLSGLLTVSLHFYRPTHLLMGLVFSFIETRSLMELFRKLHLRSISVDSETFDLAGASTATIQQTISDAFSEPFPLSKMIRLTFITGAGKLERQKYDENAARIVMTVLRDYGYQEDRGASAVMECAGTFKSQHDTGKNLKTVVVFPKISPQNPHATTQSSNSSELSSSSKDDKVDAKTSILQSSFPTFQKLIELKCLSWTQKKACLQLISDTEEQLRALDTKLMNGNPLTATEQELYDSMSMEILEQKSNFLKTELAKHIDEENITQTEKEKLIRQTQDRMDILNKEMESVVGKKKLESLQLQKDKATARLQTLKQLQPKLPTPLKHAADIARLRKELKPLLQLEAETKGRLLTIKEATTMARKGEIMDEIKKLEVSTYIFFISDLIFIPSLTIITLLSPLYLYFKSYMG